MIKCKVLHKHREWKATVAPGSNDTCEFYHIGFSLRFRGDKNETNEMLACFSFYKLSGSNKLQCCFCPPGLSAHYVTHQPNHLNTSEQHTTNIYFTDRIYFDC